MGDNASFEAFWGLWKSVRVSGAHLGAPKWLFQPKSLGKWLQTVPQNDSKATQIDMGGSFTTYGIYSVEATLGHLGSGRKAIFVLLVFQAPTFLSTWRTFLDFRVRMVLQMETSFQSDWIQITMFLDKAPTRGHSGIQERSRSRNLFSNGAPGCWNRVQNRPSERCFWWVLWLVIGFVKFDADSLPRWDDLGKHAYSTVLDIAHVCIFHANLH